MTRRAILHIGIPRTGTTSFQRVLSRRRAQLQEQGVLYPDLTPLSASQKHLSHQYLGEALDGRRSRLEKFELLGGLSQQLCSTAADVVLLSYEGFSQSNTRGRSARLLGKLFASHGFATEVLITIKSQADWLNSSYTWRTQFLREDRNFSTFARAERNSRRLDYARLLAPWRDVSQGRLTIVPTCDVRSSQPLIYRILNEIGLLDRLASLVQPDDLSLVENRSPGPIAVEVARRLRRGGVHRALGSASREATRFVEDACRAQGLDTTSFRGVDSALRTDFAARWRSANDRLATDTWGASWTSCVAEDHAAVNEIERLADPSPSLKHVEELIEATCSRFNLHDCSALNRDQRRSFFGISTSGVSWIRARLGPRAVKHRTDTEPLIRSGTTSSYTMRPSREHAPQHGLIILDISRLLSRATRCVPTGIDRVEQAYADGLLRSARSRLRYAAMNPLGKVSIIPQGKAREFVEQTGQEWGSATSIEAPDGPQSKTVLSLARRLQAGSLLPNPARYCLRHTSCSAPTYLLVSHHHLDQPKAVEAAKRRFSARFVCFVHDLIPIEFPEYNRPLEAAKHRRRIETATQLADALVVNSSSTAEALRPFIAAAGRDVPLLVAPLGVHRVSGRATGSKQDRPYFLYVGTIEPRKNHLLLFHVWRRLVLEMGNQAPLLILVGQRGWENEMVIDVLERSQLLKGHVVEHNGLPDDQVQTLIAGARAVLLPSFAEGYGLPVAEALAADVPVICSDLPALREVGADVPEYLDPVDALAWLEVIRDYAAPHSLRREQQIARIDHWSAPSWPAHLDAVLALIDSLHGHAA
jgi:glycosyltransferase involved in cell wall biosynthesis